MPDSPNGPPEQPFLVKLLPSSATAVYTFLVAIQGIAGIANLAAGRAITSSTEPTAGHTFNYSIAASASEPKGRRLIRYEVANPGPGDVSGYSLKIIVPDGHDDAKHVFTSGITVSRSGACNYDCKPDGDNTLIEVFPRNGSEKNGVLAAGSRFGVLVNAPDAEWKPTVVRLVTPANIEMPAELEMPPPSWKWTVWNAVRDISPWLLIATSIITTAGFWMLHFRLKRHVADEVARGAKENEARGYNKGQKDAQIQSQIRDGTNDSDPYEEEVRRAHDAHTPAAPPQNAARISSRADAQSPPAV